MIYIYLLYGRTALCGSMSKTIIQQNKDEEKELISYGGKYNANPEALFGYAEQHLVSQVAATIVDYCRCSRNRL